jgi:hypothetical protein
VKRGPDWRWGSQDGGDGDGTVQSKNDAGWCKVKFDNGGSNSYRVGLSGAYDLCIAPGSTGSARCDESALETCAALGDHNYIQQCCQGSCAYGYDNCYFCPAWGRFCLLNELHPVRAGRSASIWQHPRNSMSC